MRSFRFLAVAALLCASATVGCSRGGSGSGSPAPTAVSPTSPAPAPQPAPPPAPAPAPEEVDLDVDTDRDGQVEATAQDDQGEDAWSASAGAVIYYNIDDDDTDGLEDAFDTAVNGVDDELDLARVVVRAFPGMPAGGTAVVHVAPSSAEGRIRVFRKQGAGWTQVYASGSSFALPAADVQSGPIELAVEAKSRILPAWDGRVSLTLAIADDAGQPVGSDTVQLRCAPWIMATNLWTIEELHVVNLGAENQAFRGALQSICSAAGVALVQIPGSAYAYDRWIQDSSEPGVVSLPSPSGRRRIDSVLQCARWREVDDWCEDALHGPDFDFVKRFSTSTSSMNYGGNLEIIPPHTAPDGTVYPWGRILVGGGTSAPLGGGSTITRRMTAAYRDFFNALGIQGPHLEASTEWLAVGHVDEHTAVIPAPATARGWVLGLASPALARQVLQNVQAAGGGAKIVFQGRSSQTTVNAILNNTGLMAYNQEAQIRMNAVRQYYMNSIGLAGSEIVDLPVLFEDVGGGEAAAYNPGVVNLVVLPRPSGEIHLVVPDPEGPDHPAADAWQTEIVNRLQALGTSASPVTVHFVDVFEPYHEMLGEAHCGTNAVRTPPAEDWWDD